MTDLLQIDEKFNSQLKEIESVPWPVLRLVMLRNLDRMITENLLANQQLSYRLQIKPIILETLLEICERPAIDPAILEWGYFVVLAEADNAVKMKLERIVAPTYFRLGAFKQLTSFLNQVTELEFSVDISDDSLHRQQDSFIRQLADRLPQPLLDGLNEIVSNRQFTSSPTTINGLFVLQHGRHSVGIVAGLSCEQVIASNKLALDQVRIATHLVDESDVLSEQTRSVCRYLRRKFRYPEGTHFRLEFALDQPSSILAGSSAGLALACLGQIGLTMYKSNRKFQPRIYSDIAFTGAIDDNGNILPVAERSLRHKIEAAFFGKIKLVVVPAPQGKIAEKALANLRQEYPNRNLEILPLASIDDLDEHRTIVHYERRKLSSRISQFVKDYANTATYNMMAFIILAAAGFWFGIVKNPVPDRAEWRVKDLASIVYNKFGFRIWQAGRYGEAVLDDIDGDGKTEILVGFTRDAETGYRGCLYCYNQDFSLRWKNKLGHDVRYGDMTYSDFFSVHIRAVHNFNRDGEKEIFVQVGHNYFPVNNVIIDRHGKVLSEYWHSGDLSCVEIADFIPDNGTDELILAGQNNEFNSGVLIVLDPFKMFGASPQSNPYYTMEDSRIGGEIAFIKFPTTHFQAGQVRDEAKILGINENGVVRIALVNYPVIDSGENGELVLYHFNRNLDIQFVDLSDFYYKSFEKFFTDKPRLKYNDPELIKYFTGVDYWDGENWIKEPTMNKLYSK